MSGKVYEARKQGWLSVTLTQGEAKLWLQTKRQQDSHAASLLFSLCLKAFSLLYMVALALVFIFGGTWTLLYVWVYGCMYVWCYSHSFALLCTCTLFVFWRLFLTLC